MNEQPQLLRQERAGILTLTLARPEARNALNPALLNALMDALLDARERGNVRAVILTGAGERVFSAGADIRYLSQAGPLDVRAFAARATELTWLIEHLGKPTIAALNGDALGGGLEVAEACTLRIAADHARLGHPEVRIGAVAGFGGTTRLPRLIGKGRAADMLLRARLIDATEARAIGLVQDTCPAEALAARAVAIAEDILRHAPLAVRLTWEAMHRGLEVPMDESARLGADFFGLAACTEDFRIGTRAFLSREEPQFSGR